MNLSDIKIAIIITSCDAYDDCWKPMVFSLDKYWPNREWPTYVITNYKQFEIKNATIINIGDDKRCWCNLTKKGLEAIGADYVFFFQEDYWLSHAVDNDAMKLHLQYMIENDVDYLKIQHEILRDKYRIGDTDYCKNELNIRYAFDTAIAIWKVSAIAPLMIDGWNGWYFERNIIPYVQKNNIKINSQVLHSSVVDSKGINTINMDAIVRGVWTQSAVAFMRENNFEDLIDKRPIMGPITTWLYNNNNKPYLHLFTASILKLFKTINVNF